MTTLPTAAQWKQRANAAEHRETYYAERADRRNARRADDMLFDDVRHDYDIDVRRAMLALAGAHGTAAVLYQARHLDAARDEATQAGAA